MSGKIQSFALSAFALLIVGCSPAQFDITKQAQDGNNIPNAETDDDCDCVCEVDYPKHQNSMASAMWEDLFPNPIDADYNDFITNFRIKEKYGRKGLQKIVIEFKPRGKASAYDHKLLLSLDGQLDDCGLPKTEPMFEGPAKSIKIEYFEGGQRVSTVRHSDKHKDIVIFESSQDLFHDKDGNIHANANVVPGTEFMRAYKKVRVTITVKKPGLNRPHPEHDRRKIDLRKYRMALFVKDTGNTIDLINVNPAHFDANGYPYGMILPTDFRYPLEKVEVDTVYNLFPQYRDYLFNSFNDPDYPVSEEILHWYDQPAPESTGRIFDRSLFD